MDREYLFIKLLTDPATTIERVKEEYIHYPRLSGHMVEDLVYKKVQPEFLDFLVSVNWFRMAGRDVYEGIQR